MDLQTEFNPVPKPTFKKTSKSKEFSKATKDEVRERSQGVCEICKQRKAVQFHHAIYRKHANREQARDISNCLYLCIPCHNAVHETKAMREYAVDLAKELAGVQSSYVVSGGGEVESEGN